MTDQNFEHMRRAMVASQLRTTGVADARVIAAMGEVPRERFVPAERQMLAYADALTELGGGRQLNTPMALGRLLSESSPRAHDRALVIGAATGYAAAVLDRLVASVVAIEEDPALAAFASKALAGTKVKLVEAPLTGGYKRGRPYDLILIDGAVETIPLEIVDQLADDGRIAVAMLEDGVPRLSIGRKGGEGFGLTAYSDAAAPVLPGFEKVRAFSF